MFTDKCMIMSPGQRLKPRVSLKALCTGNTEVFLIWNPPTDTVLIWYLTLHKQPMPCTILQYGCVNNNTHEQTCILSHKNFHQYHTTWNLQFVTSKLLLLKIKGREEEGGRRKGTFMSPPMAVIVGFALQICPTFNGLNANLPNENTVLVTANTNYRNVWLNSSFKAQYLLTSHSRA